MSRILYNPRKIKQKQSVRSRILFVMLKLFIAFTVVGASFVILVHIKRWQISDYQIIGATSVSQEQITGALSEIFAGNYALVAPRSSFFLVTAGGVQKKLLAAFPKLKNVVVHKQFPNTVKVSLSERTLWAVACDNPNVFGTEAMQSEQGSSTPPTLSEGEIGAPTESVGAVLDCVYIDDQGYAYETAPDISGTLILRIHLDAGRPLLNTQVVDQGRIMHLKEILSAMEQATGDRMVGVEFSSKVPSEIRLKAGSGYMLYLNWEDDFTNVSRVLKRVLTDEIKTSRKKVDYIDLRFGNKVFYKMR